MAALVLGNADYKDGGKLKNPAHDAADMAAKLESYGFHVITATDATNQEMDKKLKDFRILLGTSDVGLFFFAGHGMQIEGHNYFLAVDTDTSGEDDAKHSSLSLDRVIEVMEKSKASTKIIILDACRNNPWERAWHRSATIRGLASVYAPKGTIIGFATSPGELACDGKGRNGTYTEALLQHIDDPDLPIETMFKHVRNTVAAKTGGKQTSWEHTSLSGNFFFNISLGKVVTAYPPEALADDLFVIDETKPSHVIIKRLRSYNWYVQNDALGQLTAALAKKIRDENLFVLGRNIYQAACGDSNVAKTFIQSFFEMTSSYPGVKRKALLDGMLFEVFFDPKAELRPAIKANYFNEVFDLQKHPELRGSFEFLSEAVAASHGEFYALPGRNHDLAVTVAATKVKEAYRIGAVYVGGKDVLRLEDDEWATDDEQKLYKGIDATELEEQLSYELAVPTRLLKITYTPPEAAKGDLKFPHGYTVRKP